MRIKKTAQTTTTQAQISDGYSTSKIDGYSCDYVNNAIKDTYSTTETKTNKIWIDGKPIYRKVIETTMSSTTSQWQYVEIPEADILIDVSGFWIKSNEAQHPLVRSIGSESVVWYFDVSNKRFNFQHTYTYPNGAPVKIIVEYIKTS